MRFKKTIMTALVVYLGFVVVTLPASTLLPRLLAGVPALELHGLHGTLWSGSADVVVVKGEKLPALRWTLLPKELLAAKLALDWQLGQSGEPVSGKGLLRLGTGGAAELHATELHLPAERVVPYLELPGFKLAGAFHLTLDKAQLAGQRIDALKGKLFWNKAFIASPYGQSPLGDLVADVSDKDGGVQGMLSQLQGPLDLKGTFSLKPNGDYRSDGSVTSQLPEQLASFFQIVGRPDNQGRIVFWYQGNAHHKPGDPAIVALPPSDMQ